MKPRKFLIIMDDFGEKTYTISSYRDGCYYLYQKNFDGWRLRYNSKESVLSITIPKAFGM